MGGNLYSILVKYPIMGNREQECFREDFAKSLYTFDNMRLVDNRVLARHVDSEAVNKCRVKMFKKQNEMVRRMTIRNGDYDDMERARASKGDYRLDCREFALHENMCQIYFDYYGHNFTGGDIVDNPDHPYICPKCGLKYKMSPKTLPEYCKRCDNLTPMGEMVRDGVMKR